MPIKATREPSAADKQAVKELFYEIPLLERGQPLMAEMIWVLSRCPNPDQHIKILPDYCYHIFDVFMRTYFKGFPSLSETVQVLDAAGLSSARTIDEAKTVLRLTWRNLGKMFGIASRCFRYGELEAAKSLEHDGFGDSTPARDEELLMVLAGRQWVEKNRSKLAGKSFSTFAVEMLNQRIKPQFPTVMEAELKFQAWAYEWGPVEMQEFNAGMAEGLTALLDEDGELAGESGRSGIYVFLLVVWPEIKAMLNASPNKTLSDLHEWMQPFMRVGVITYIGIDTLRDVCAPVPSGIGLSLRPLKKSSA
jgi:hypothetical protein